MPNAPVPASAEGLPSVNRRRLLLGLAAASTAAATVTGTVAIAATAPVQENPELVRLGDELQGIYEVYDKAAWHAVNTRKEWEPQWPAIPDELATTRWRGVLWRSFAGAHFGTYYIPSREFEWRVSEAKRALRSKATKRVWHAHKTQEEWHIELEQAEHLLGVARRFESEMKRVEEGAQWESCWQATHATGKALSEHITKIMAEPDQTMAGLIIKAEALSIWGQVEEGDQQYCFHDADLWAEKIGEAILRHAKGGAA